MPLPRPSRVLATGAVTAGAALFGVALGGLATVDGELRAAAPTAPPAAVETQRVTLAAPATRGLNPRCPRDGIAGTVPSVSQEL